MNLGYDLASDSKPENWYSRDELRGKCYYLVLLSIGQVNVN